MIDEHGFVEVIDNEYASVSVSIDGHGNDRRLELVDNLTGRRAYFDALTLESLVWLPERAREQLLDPSAHRWSSATESSEPGPEV